jgi:hypothetical protein
MNRGNDEASTGKLKGRLGLQAIRGETTIQEIASR